MFAPNPVRDTVALEAVIQTNQGILKTIPFTRTADLPVLDALAKYRHAKYTAMLGADVHSAAREFTARNIARTAGLKPSDFPAKVQLLYRYWPATEPGQGPPDLMAAPKIQVLQTYLFENLQDALP
jgi:hypothetical protein